MALNRRELYSRHPVPGNDHFLASQRGVDEFREMDFGLMKSGGGQAVLLMQLSAI